MTKLDFSGPILDSKGIPSLGSNLGELLSQLLMQSAIKPPMSAKFFTWGLELGTGGVISVEDADKAVLLDFVNTSEQLTVLGRGRLAEVFNLPVVAAQVPVVSPAISETPEAVIPTPEPETEAPGTMASEDNSVAVDSAS